MSKLLFAIEMVLMSTKIATELPKGTVFGRGQLSKLQHFVQFVVFCYVPWWLTSPVPASAPKNDQLLINSFLEYCKVDVEIANTALKSFKNHLWYLTEELVVLSLFSSLVDNSMKAKIVNKMLEEKGSGLETKWYGQGFGKPRFPKITKH